VDIFITTYNEPAELVKGTVEAANKILWPDKKVYILDDGNRKEFFDLAGEYGCEIITRGEEWKGKPRHAKAGNVNNALLQTSGEFILILDADHLTGPDFIDRIIGYFRDERVAFVQTPQHFYNIPPGDPFGSDAPLFYGPILKGKDGWNSAFFCGTNAILRREALLELGIVEYVETSINQGKRGLQILNRWLRKRSNWSLVSLEAFRILKSELRAGKRELEKGEPLEELYGRLLKTLKETGYFNLLPKEIVSAFDITRPKEAIPLLPISTLSVTEDMATSMRLHSRGWKSVYHPDILAQGLAPEDLKTALSQRLRWAQGTIQVLLKSNPLTVKGLTPAQRIQYFTTIYSYFSGFATLIFILSPIIFLFTGLAPVTSYSGEFLWRLIPFLLFNRFMFRYAAKGTKVTRGEHYSVALFPVWIKAVVSVFSGRNPKFIVTAKERQSGRHYSAIRVQAFFILLSLASVLFCLYRIITGGDVNYLGAGINIFWAGYNILHLFTIVRAAFYNPPADWEKPSPETIIQSRETR